MSEKIVQLNEEVINASCTAFIFILSCDGIS